MGRVEPIKDALGTLMQDLRDKRRQSPAGSQDELLKKIFSAKELKHLRFASLKKGVLRINVESSSWLYYLNLKKSALLEKLTRESTQIKEIRFGIGEVGE